MSRKTATLTAQIGRDKGKVFFLTEMPSWQGEKWAMRAFLAIARHGVQIPDDIASLGLQGIAAMGISTFAKMSFEDAESLLDEMFTCVQLIPSKGAAPRAIDMLMAAGQTDSDIEEIATRLWLRKEVLGLHMDFSALAGRLTSAMSAGQKETSPSL